MNSYFCWIVLLCLPGSLAAQPSLFDVLHLSGDTVVLELETDWRQLIRKKSKKTYQPTQLTLTYPGGAYEFTGKIRSRGNIRLEVCHLPSLKLKIPKKQVTELGFGEPNEFKLVLQCTESKLGESYLLRERLVYDLHAVFSPYTHRTIPARLLVNGETIQAFLLEEEEQLANRLEGRVFKVDRVSRRALQREAYVNMCMFNYLVLNSDWNVFNSHNVELVNPNGTAELIPIPYDFDYSGFVGTSYAVPNDVYEISSIYVPLWLGHQVTEEEIAAVAAHYLERREAATALLTDYPHLRDHDRNRLLKRLDAFYEQIGDEKRLFKMLDSRGR